MTIARSLTLSGSIEIKKFVATNEVGEDEHAEMEDVAIDGYAGRDQSITPQEQQDQPCRLRLHLCWFD